MISLAVFLFLFLSRFLIMAFVAAIFLTFISFMIKAVKYHARHSFGQEDYGFYRDQKFSLPVYEEKPEPLFFERQPDRAFSWSPNYRTIDVR
jgi:hypothetical protein